MSCRLSSHIFRSYLLMFITQTQLVSICHNISFLRNVTKCNLWSFEFGQLAVYTVYKCTGSHYSESIPLIFIKFWLHNSSHSYHFVIFIWFALSKWHDLKKWLWYVVLNFIAKPNTILTAEGRNILFPNSVLITKWSSPCNMMHRAIICF